MSSVVASVQSVVDHVHADLGDDRWFAHAATTSCAAERRSGESFENQRGYHRVNVAWLLVCGFRIFTMQGAFAVLESGVVRKQHVTAVMIKNLGDIIFGTCSWWLLGYFYITEQSLSAKATVLGFCHEGRNTITLVAYLPIRIGLEEKVLFSSDSPPHLPRTSFPYVPITHL